MAGNSESWEFNNLQKRMSHLHFQKTGQSLPEKQESNNSELENILIKQQENLYKVQWGRLNEYYKINRIKNFVIDESKRRNLSEKETNQLKLLLVDSIKSKRITSKSEVIYNVENGTVESVNDLEFDNGIFYLKEKNKKKRKKTPVKNISNEDETELVFED